MDTKKRFKLLTICMWASLAVALIGFIVLIVCAIKAAIIGIAVGVVLMLGGFALTGFTWYWRIDGKQLMSVVNAITKKGIEDIDEIAKACKLTGDDTRSLIGRCISNGDIVGYIRIGNKVVKEEEYKAEAEAAATQEKAVKCPGCGATFVAEGDVDRCPYCGTFINIK